MSDDTVIDLEPMIVNPNYVLSHSLAGDNQIRDMLKSAQEQGLTIVPFVREGKKQYTILRKVDGKQVSFNPILHGDWIEGFPKGED